jgi:DNA-binding transcriptional ArsR family regulator
MARITLQADGFSDWKFAISPLHALVELLYFRTRVPHLVPRQWTAVLDEAASGRRCRLLAELARLGAAAYLPDFLAPEPALFEGDPDDELHRVAMTPAERVAFEMRLTIQGLMLASRQARSRPPAILLDAVDRGEQELAEELAGQLAHLWRTTVAPRWPVLRSRLEADITHRSRLFSQDGLAAMLAGLHSAIVPTQDGLTVDLVAGSYLGCGDWEATTGSVILMPAAFGHRPLITLDPPAAPARRTALISYPSVASAYAEPAQLGELIGTTRAQLLDELRTAQSPGQLARRLHLSPSTVSYHLQILTRAGLAFRTRDAGRVYYQAADPVGGPVRIVSSSSLSADLK